MRTPATGSDPGVDAAVDGSLETAWRDQWGRLTALLVAQFRRLDLAEDGLADAFEAAARTWPRDGVPTNPPAWLLTSAPRRIPGGARGRPEAPVAPGRVRSPGGGAARDGGRRRARARRAPAAGHALRASGAL